MTQTDGELLFEQYLNERGFKWSYEQPTGTTQPDYLIQAPRGNVLCEVKDFDQNTTDRALIGGAVLGLDPYSRIRDKIRRARRQFKPYKGRGVPCVLILHNNRSVSQTLDGFAIYGAMFGNLGFEVELKPPYNSRQHVDTTKATLRRLENTTISGIAVLDRYRFHQPWFDEEVQKRISTAAFDDVPEDERSLRVIEEIWRASEAIQQEHPTVDFDSTVPRVRWLANPHAAVPMPAIFSGPNDRILEPFT